MDIFTFHYFSIVALGNYIFLFPVLRHLPFANIIRHGFLLNQHDRQQTTNIFSKDLTISRSWQRMMQNSHSDKTNWGFA